MSAALALLVRYWWAPVIAALVLAVAASRGQTLKTRERFAAYQAATEKNLREASEAARVKEQRDRRIADEEAQHARDEKQTLEADVVRLAGVADGLRGDLADFQRRASRAPGAAVGGKSQPGSDPLALLADLYRGSVEDNRVLARYADELRIAGSACERTADKIATPQP